MVATSSPTDRAKMKSMTSAVWRLACPDEYETDAVRHALRRSAMPSSDPQWRATPDLVRLNRAGCCGWMAQAAVWQLDGEPRRRALAGLARTYQLTWRRGQAWRRRTGWGWVTADRGIQGPNAPRTCR